MGKDSDKKIFIGFSIFGVLIMFILIICYSFMYKYKTYLFDPYDKKSNPYIVNSDQEGLQYLPLPSNTDIFVDTSSTAASQKDTMIQKALSSLETNGNTNGYIETESITSKNKFMTYFILIVVILIIIACISSYAAFIEK